MSQGGLHPVLQMPSTLPPNTMIYGGTGLGQARRCSNAEEAKYGTSCQGLWLLRQQERRGSSALLWARRAKLTSSVHKENQFNMRWSQVLFQKQRWVYGESSQQDPRQQKICKCPLESTPARSCAFAGELGFLTQKKHKCPSILD